MAKVTTRMLFAVATPTVMSVPISAGMDRYESVSAPMNCRTSSTVRPASAHETPSKTSQHEQAERIAIPRIRSLRGSKRTEAGGTRSL